MNRQYSLKKNKEFNYVFRRGKSVANKNLVLYFVKTRKEDLKVGFSVSKKIGKSVIRNKVKRRLKASFDSMFDEIEKDTLLVFIARAGIQDLDYQEIYNNTRHILKKAGLLKVD